MSGNIFGTLFSVTSFGESHGPAIGCVVDGCPPGMEISAEYIQHELDRRKPGTSRHVTQRRESDSVEILSGVYEGKTTGTPIALLIRNEDQRSKDYCNISESFRPGHADYTYWQKYGIRDPRGGGRSSARETAVRVAAGAIAKKWLHERYGVLIRGYMVQLGEIIVPFKSWDGVNENPFFVADDSYVAQLEEYMDALRKSGDSIGAKLTVVAENVPVVLPSYTPESISTESDSRRCVTWREVPGLRRSSSCWIYSAEISIPGGQPSTTQPIAGPCDSPKEVTLNKVPKIFPDMAESA